MRNDLTDITLIVDRSGSMHSCRADSEGGINSFIESQKKASGDCLFTLVEFDTEYNFVYNGVNIKDTTPYTLVPRGWTALRDALGRAINEAGVRLAAMPENERPGLVLFVVVTDGLDNRSYKFTSEQIKSMIGHQESKYSWKFTYLGAAHDAFTASSALGFTYDNTSHFSLSRSRDAYEGVNSQVILMRNAVGDTRSDGFKYSALDRKAMQ